MATNKTNTKNIAPKTANDFVWTSAGVAARKYGVDAKELVRYHRNFKTAPASLKRPLLLMYKVLKGYAPKKPAAETAAA